MGHGDPGILRHGDGRSHTGNKRKLRPPLPQVDPLFTSTPEDKRIAPLEPDDGFVLLGGLVDHFVDLLLRESMVAVFLAHVDKLAAVFGLFEDLRVGKAIVNDHIGFADHPQRFEGEQFNVAGTGSGEVDHGYSCLFLVFRSRQSPIPRRVCNSTPKSQRDCQNVPVIQPSEGAQLRTLREQKIRG